MSDDKPVTIANFAFLDDDELVKVYVTLDGDLEGVTTDCVKLTCDRDRFNPTSSMLLSVRGKQYSHALGANPLCHCVDPAKCKFRVLSKKGKLVVTLQKENAGTQWDTLRAPNHLPFRRGGGGGPSGGSDGPGPPPRPSGDKPPPTEDGTLV